MYNSVQQKLMQYYKSTMQASQEALVVKNLSASAVDIRRCGFNT